jgi:hypothetical protein
MIAVCEISEPCRSTGRRDQGVKVVLVHHAVDALLTRKSVICCERIEILLVCQRAFFLSLD